MLGGSVAQAAQQFVEATPQRGAQGNHDRQRRTFGSGFEGLVIAGADSSPLGYLFLGQRIAVTQTDQIAGKYLERKNGKAMHGTQQVASSSWRWEQVGDTTRRIVFSPSLRLKSRFSGAWSGSVFSALFMQSRRRIHFALIFLIAQMLAMIDAPKLRADTYEAWKARVFTPSEQADPAVSGPDALAPSGDGFTNLLHYAFGANPHLSSAGAVPEQKIVWGYNTQTGQTDNFLSLRWQVPSDNYPYDLDYVPEMRADLLSGDWLRGSSVLTYTYETYPQNSGDPYYYTSQTLAPLSQNPHLFMRLRVIKGKTLPEDYQLATFGRTGVDGNGDEDHDQISNFDEFLSGMDPTDYYNGSLPKLAIFSGGNQRGSPGTVLPVPVSVSVNSYGSFDAPITFTVTSGAALLSPTNSGSFAPTATVNVRSTSNYPDAQGYQHYVAQVYVYLPSTANNQNVIQASATSAGRSTAVTTTAVATDPSVGTPLNFTAVAVTSSSAKLRWTPVDTSRPTSIETSTDLGVTWFLVGTVAPGVANAYVLGLEADKPTRFRVFTGGDYISGGKVLSMPFSPSGNEVVIDLDADSVVTLPRTVAGSALGGYATTVGNGNTANNNGGSSGGGGSNAAPAGEITPLTKPLILGAQVSQSQHRYGYDPFIEVNPKTKYFNKVITTNLEGGCPESAVGGTATYTMDKETGEVTTSQSGNPSYYDYPYDTVISATSAKGSTSVTEYDDPPNEKEDCPGTMKTDHTLSDPQTTPQFRTMVEGMMDSQSFSDGVEGVDSAQLYFDRDGEMYYSITKLRYKINFGREGANYLVTWEVQFSPADGGDTTHTVFTWKTEGATESPFYYVLPHKLNPGVNGNYRVVLTKEPQPLDAAGNPLNEGEFVGDPDSLVDSPGAPGDDGTTNAAPPSSTASSGAINGASPFLYKYPWNSDSPNPRVSVTVRKKLIHIKLFDAAVVDGDQVQIIINNKIYGTYTLTGPPGMPVTIKGLREGINRIETKIVSIGGLRDGTVGLTFEPKEQAYGDSLHTAFAPAGSTPTITVGFPWVPITMRHPESKQHAEEAIGRGWPRLMTIDREGADARGRSSIARFDSDPTSPPVLPGQQRDEYPQKLFIENLGRADVKPISGSDNGGSGSVIGRYCGPYADGENIEIVTFDQNF